MFYTTPETRWIMFFLLYSFLGWVFESCYVSLKSKRWINRGFMKGPFLPIYGTGAIMMLVVAEPFKDNLVLTYFAGVVGATLLELVVGIAIEKIFKVRYWDYSYKRFHYKGYICLSSSIAWGFFTIAMTRWIHPAVNQLLASIPGVLSDVVFAMVSIAFCVDLVISVREALDLRNILIYMEEAGHEIQLMKKRADVLMAVVDDELETIKATSPVIDLISDSPVFKLFSDMKESLEDQLALLRVRLPQIPNLNNKHVNEFQELQDRFTAFKKKSTEIRLPDPSIFIQRLKGNPTMTSRKYSASLDMLKQGLDINGQDSDTARMNAD